MGLYLLYPMLYRITLQCPFLAVRTGCEHRSVMIHNDVY